MHQRADLADSPGNHPVWLAELYTAKMCSSSLKWPSRSPTALSPSRLALSGRHWLTVPGLLGWSLFRALRKQNVSGKLQLEVKSYLYCPYFFTHNVCSTFKEMLSCERLSENSVQMKWLAETWGSNSAAGSTGHWWNCSGNISTPIS